MSNILSFEFEELPLVIANGIPAGLINGCAEIQYSRDGFERIDGISIEGYQSLTAEERAAGKRPWVYVAAPDEIATLIGQRLEAEWFVQVQDAINEKLACDREEAAEMRAEIHRDLMRL